MVHQRLRPVCVLVAVFVAVSIPALAPVDEAGAVAGFGDVADGRYYSEAVQWLTDSGITTGTSSTCFSPEDAVTRGQAAAFLWRMEGRPATAAKHGFVDVSSSWQQDAVAWLAAEEITTGTSPSTFSPDAGLTRGQFAAFLHRLADEPAAGTHRFGDVRARWQQRPVAWLHATGITTGTSATTFSPDEPVTRGQLAAFLHRYNGEPAVQIDPSSPACGGGATLVGLLLALVGSPDPDRPAYDRDRFLEGADLDGDCVRTRDEVLRAEAIIVTMAGCEVVAGRWFDPFTGRHFSDPADLEVDHVVALGDAWRSGAWAWDDRSRERFSNDLANLNAIAAGENATKWENGPARYRPTNAAQTCAYLAQYAVVKIAYRLSVTPEDFGAVRTGLGGCSSVAPASPGAPPSPTACHPAYAPCLPDLPGDAMNCGDIAANRKPVTVLVPGVDPYRLDADEDGIGCG